MIDERMHLIRTIYHTIFTSRFSGEFYKIFLQKKRLLFGSNYNILNCFGDVLFTELVDFAITNKNTIEFYIEELISSIVMGINHFENQYDNKSKEVLYFLSTIEKLSKNKSLRKLVRVVFSIEKKELYFDNALYEKLFYVGDQMIEAKDPEETIRTFYNSFTENILNCKKVELHKEFLNKISQMKCENSILLMLYNIIIDNITKNKKLLQDECNKLNASLLTDIQSINTSNPSSSIKKEYTILKQFEKLLVFITQIIKAIKEHGFVSMLRKSILSLIHFEEFCKFGILVNEHYEMKKKDDLFRYLFNPLLSLNEFNAFYEDKENLLTDFFFTEEDNSIIETGKESNITELIKPFISLVHFHSNPFIFKILNHLISNPQDLQSVLKLFCNEFVGSKVEMLNHNTSFFVNLIRLLTFINSNYNIENLWNKGLTAAIHNMFFYLQKIGFLSLRYICFIEEKKKEQVIKKNIVECLFDLFLHFYNIQLFEEECICDLINTLININDKPKKRFSVLSKNDYFHHYFSNSSLQYFDKLEMIPKEQYILLFFCKILEIIFDRKHKESDIDNNVMKESPFVNIAITILRNIKSSSIIKSISGKSTPTQSKKINQIIRVLEKWDAIDIEAEKKNKDKDTNEFIIFMELFNNELNKFNKMHGSSSSSFYLKSYSSPKIKEESPISQWKDVNKDDKKLKSNIKKVVASQSRDESENNLDDINYYLIFPKTDLLLSSFGLIFKKYYFHNDLFISLKNYYHSLTNDNRATKRIDYPTKIMNFSNSYEPNLFLSQNMNFFDNKYFHITHKYFCKKVPHPKIKKITLLKSLSLFDFSLFPPIDCEMITRQNIYRGAIYFSNLLIYFTSAIPTKFDENTLDYIMCSITKEVEDNTKEVVIQVKDIKEIVLKRFLYIEQAYEIYLRNGKSYFINFYTPQQATNFKEHICALFHIAPKDCKVNYTSNKISIITNGITYIKEYHSEWRTERMSTYMYLCYLNKYGSRTFNDTNQYYVFPWVIMKYDNFFEWDMRNEPLLSHCRDLNYPPSVQEEENKEKAREKYELSSFENDEKKVFAYHFGSHYSTSSFVFYYLMRMSPFIENLIKLQNNELEAPDRMFTSITESRKIIINLFDNRELIPEFYSMMEFLLNLNCCAFGKQSNSELIDDWKLEDLTQDKKQFEIKDYVLFFTKNRLYLHFCGRIHMNEWIDNVFGVNQLTKGNNKESINIFPKSTYEQKTNLRKKIEKYCIKNKIKVLPKDEALPKELVEKIQEKKSIILNFGQAPKQLFHTKVGPHGSIDSLINNDNKDEFSYFGNFRKQKTGVYNTFTLKQPIVYFFRLYSTEFNYFSVMVLNDRTIYIKKTEDSKHEEFSKSDFIQLPHFKLFKDKNKKFRYCPKYLICSVKNGMYLISCRYIDNSFFIQTFSFDKKKLNQNKQRKVYCDSFVSAVCKINDELFLTGQSNGKLSLWNIINVDQLKVIRCVFAHKGPITVVEYDLRLNIIITGGEDHFVYIRKEETFELLTVIEMEKYQIPYLIRVSEFNLVYIMSYCLKQKKYVYMFDYTKYQQLFDSKEEQEKIRAKKDAIKNKEKDDANKLIAECKLRPLFFHPVVEKEEEDNNKKSKNRGKYMITGYTLSGMKFANTNNIDISCFHITKEGNLMISFYQKKTFEIYLAHSLTVSKLGKLRLSHSNNDSFITWFDFPQKFHDNRCLYSTFNGFLLGMSFDDDYVHNMICPIKQKKKKEKVVMNNHNKANNNNEGGEDRNSQRTNSSTASRDNKSNI